MSAADFITHCHHRGTEGQHQGENKILYLSISGLLNPGINRWTFKPVIVAAVVITAVAIILTVLIIMFTIIRNKIIQRKTVMACYKVN